MTLAYWCILVAGLMPVLTVAIAKASPKYNNRNPRAWLEKQEGAKLRANFAHINHFEAFPFFAAGVIIAQQMHVAQSNVDTLAIGFIAARIVYTVLYLIDSAALRSVAWMVGYGCVITLFIRAGMAG